MLLRSSCRARLHTATVLGCAALFRRFEEQVFALGASQRLPSHRQVRRREKGLELFQKNQHERYLVLFVQLLKRRFLDLVEIEQKFAICLKQARCAI